MIEFSHVSKLFGAQKAVNDLNLNFQEGSFSVLIGTSGSGKSTTLKMINRLVEHDSGEIRFAGEEIRSLPVLELRRRMGYAIQSIGLFPHWSVAQNIATVPQLQKWSRARIDDRIDELMTLLGLESNLRERYPHQLSGGQQQRVGVARALAADPQVLLMDEPFGALDPVTRGALQQEMTRIHRLLGRTIVLVTHDIDEALRLAEHLVLMDHGEVVQQGDWEDWEQEGALQAIRASLLSLSDSQGALENFYLGQIAAGVEETPEELAAALEQVTKERIVAAAQTVKPDTVYFLRGKEEA